MVDREGARIGKIEDVFLDRRTVGPGWAAVKSVMVRLRRGTLEVDEPLMLLTILDVERHFQRRRLACGHQYSLRMLDHVLDSLNIRIGGLELAGAGERAGIDRAHAAVGDELHDLRLV
jgi:hypothetical protein